MVCLEIGQINTPVQLESVLSPPSLTTNRRFYTVLADTGIFVGDKYLKDLLILFIICFLTNSIPLQKNLQFNELISFILHKQ